MIKFLLKRKKREKLGVLFDEGIYCYLKKFCKCFVFNIELLFWFFSLKVEVIFFSSDLNIICDCFSLFVSYNNLSNEILNFGNENGFYGFFKFELGFLDLGIYFWIVWVNIGWDTDNFGFFF